MSNATKIEFHSRRLTDFQLRRILRACLHHYDLPITAYLSDVFISGSTAVRQSGSCTVTGKSANSGNLMTGLFYGGVDINDSVSRDVGHVKGDLVSVVETVINQGVPIRASDLKEYLDSPRAAVTRLQVSRPNS